MENNLQFELLKCEKLLLVGHVLLRRLFLWTKEFKKYISTNK